MITATTQDYYGGAAVHVYGSSTVFPNVRFVSCVFAYNTVPNVRPFVFTATG
jgi:hypothetical protein